MAFGSARQGIMLVQLDGASGLDERKAPPTYPVRSGKPLTNAWGTLAPGGPAGASLPGVFPLARPPPPDKQRFTDTGADVMVEAPYLHHHGDHYFLFVNWGWCCNGVHSTYSVRVGRSKQIYGPFVDKEGKRLDEGGGTIFLPTRADPEQRGALRGLPAFVGPGHIAIAPWFPATSLPGGGAHVVRPYDDAHVVSFHSYDPSAPVGADASGARLEIRPLLWDKDGWPVVGSQQIY